MFDIGWPELVVIAVAIIVVVGPKDLPRALRAFGKTTGQMRKMAGDFRKQFDDALKEAELDEIRNLAAEARKLDPTAEIRKNLDPMRKIGDEIKAGLDESVKPASAQPAATATQAEPAAAPAPDAAAAASPAPQPPVISDKPAAADKSSGASN